MGLDLENLKETDVLLLNNLQKVMKLLDEVDDLIESNSTRQSKIDGLISDYEHIIENEILTNDQAMLIVQELKKAREYRRHQKNEFELIRAYQENKEKLSSKVNRQFLMAEIYKVWTRLNQKYNMRVLNETEVEKFRTVNKVVLAKKREKRRSQKSIDLDNKIWDLYQQKKSQTEISKILGISQPVISIRLKKLKEEKNDRKQ